MQLCLLLFSWTLTLFLWSFSSCTAFGGSATHAASRTGHAPVAIVSTHSGLAWTVDELSGVISMNDRMEDTSSTALQQHFHVEWQKPAVLPAAPGSQRRLPEIEPDELFCLRWLHDLRLVEVALAGDANEHVLRLGNRYGCDSPKQLFSLVRRRDQGLQFFRGSGHSFFNLGARSIINVRSYEHLRAHGDTGPPWTPLQKETKITKMAFEPLALPPAHLERRLLDLVAKLENRSRHCAVAG